MGLVNKIKNFGRKAILGSGVGLASLLYGCNTIPSDNTTPSNVTNLGNMPPSGSGSGNTQSVDRYLDSIALGEGNMMPELALGAPDGRYAVLNNTLTYSFDNNFPKDGPGDDVIIYFGRTENAPNGLELKAVVLFFSPSHPDDFDPFKNAKIEVFQVREGEPKNIGIDIAGVDRLFRKYNDVIPRVIIESHRFGSEFTRIAAAESKYNG